MLLLSPVPIAILAAGIFFIIAGAIFAKGVDGSYSLSNVQLILWTGTILGSYIGLAMIKGNFLSDIPANLLALMGVSSGSFVTAVAIRDRQQAKKTLKEVRDDRKKLAPASLKDLLTSEENPKHYSLAKLQMLSWTIVSLAIFIYVVFQNISSQTPTLPDVGPTILTLMGISHGAYLVNKSTDNASEAKNST
jgi:hypothetical protein